MRIETEVMPEDAARQVAFRGSGFDVQAKPWVGVAFLLSLLALWQGGTAVGIIDPLFLPSPFQIAATLWHELVAGDLLLNIGQSAIRLGAGWFIGTTVGVSVGLAIGLLAFARSAGMTTISALYPIPKIALLPMFILWLGIGETSKITVIAFGVFFPTALTVVAAVDAAPRPLIRMAQSFGLGNLRIIWKIILPSALPAILAVMRITISVALILLVAAEMIGAEYGIGAYILSAGNTMQTDRLFAGVVVLSVFGLTLGSIITRLDRRLTRWR